ncbi:GSCOCG00001415001-RA-CDS [Cotesia congregata]|nr:GSCOCG00001415001-RA-CDS [Cotesia congregata]
MSNPEDHQMVSEPHQSVEELMAKYGMHRECRCDKFNEMVKLLDQEIQRFDEKSRAFWLRHPNCHSTDKSKLIELMINDLGKFDNKVTQPEDNHCWNSPILYQSIIDHQSLNNYLDYLDNNTEENELVDLFSVSRKPKKKKKKKMASKPRQSLEEFMAENGIKPTCNCAKCRVMIKLLNEKIERFNEKSRAYNYRHHYRDVVNIPNLLERLKHDEGKFENNVTKPGDNPYLNTPHIYDSLVKYETFNNYIDYLENNAEENKIADSSSM